MREQKAGAECVHGKGNADHQERFRTEYISSFFFPDFAAPAAAAELLEFFLLSFPFTSFRPNECVCLSHLVSARLMQRNSAPGNIL